MDQNSRNLYCQYNSSSCTAALTVLVAGVFVMLDLTKFNAGSWKAVIGNILLIINTFCFALYMVGQKVRH